MTIEELRALVNAYEAIGYEVQYNELASALVESADQLLRMAEAAEEAVIAEDAGFEAVNNGGDLTLAAERMSDAVEALRKALEEMNDD